MVNLIEVTTKNSLVIQLALNFTMDMHSKFSNRTHYSVLQIQSYKIQWLAVLTSKQMMRVPPIKVRFSLIYDAE